MAKLKFRRLVAEIAAEKSKDGIIDSGATHHFFHSRSSHKNYNAIYLAHFKPLQVLQE